MGDVVTQKIPWRPSSDGGPLGRHVEHDPRSRAFAFAADPAVTLHYALHVRHGKILDQGRYYDPATKTFISLGSCTGNAIVGAMMTGPLYIKNRNFGEPKAVKIYSRATVLDAFSGSYPPDDTGSSGLAVCKAALEAKNIRGYETAFGIDAAIAALMDGPVITGVDWYSGFDKPDQFTGLVRLSGSVRGGHEFLVRGYDPGGQAPWGIGGTEPTVLCDNSWGGKWGKKGSFVMTVADWSTLLDAQGDVTRPLRLQ